MVTPSPNLEADIQCDLASFKRCSFTSAMVVHFHLILSTATSLFFIGITIFTDVIYFSREHIHGLQVWFQTISEELTKMEPISTEPEKLKQQLAGTEKLQDNIQDKTHLLRSAQAEGEWMMEHSKEDEDMVIDVVTILSECQAKMDAIIAQVDRRHSRLQSAVVDSQNVEVTFAEFLDDLSRIEVQLAGMRPISVVLDTLKEQERQFEVIL